MNTQAIVNEIYQDFAKTYRGAANFVDSGSIWDFCIEIIKDPVLMSNIAFANDLEIPPCKVLAAHLQTQDEPCHRF